MDTAWCALDQLARRDPHAALDKLPPVTERAARPLLERIRSTTASADVLLEGLGSPPAAHLDALTLVADAMPAARFDQPSRAAYEALRLLHSVPRPHSLYSHAVALLTRHAPRDADEAMNRVLWVALWGNQPRVVDALMTANYYGAAYEDDYTVRHYTYQMYVFSVVLLSDKAAAFLQPSQEFDKHAAAVLPLIALNFNAYPVLCLAARLNATSLANLMRPLRHETRLLKSSMMWGALEDVRRWVPFFLNVEEYFFAHFASRAPTPILNYFQSRQSEKQK